MTPEEIEVIRVGYIKNKIMYGEIYAESRLAIKFNLDVSVPNLIALDAFIFHGVKPSKLHVVGEPVTGSITYRK